MLIFESTFPNNFRKADIKTVLDYATTSKFCQLICIPGAGKATILRLLAHNRELLKFHLGEKEKKLRFVYINFFELTDFTEAQITKLLLISLDEKFENSDDQLILARQLHESVNSLAQKGQTIIFLLDHFDEHQNRLPHTFFQLLKSLRNLAKFKFSVVFATRRDLAGLIDEDILKDYWDFFIGNTVYLKVYDKVAGEYLFSQIEKVFGKNLTAEQKSKIIKLTGGHAKLTKITTELVLGKAVKPETDTLLKEPQVVAALYEIWLFLTGAEQQALLSIARGKKPDQIDENLIDLDLLMPRSQQPGQHNLPGKRSGLNQDSPQQRPDLNLAQQSSLPDGRHTGFSFTIPIFEEFIKTTKLNLQTKIVFDPRTNEIKKGESIISELLSPQEYRLLKFLTENPQKVLGRDAIISAVWPQTQVSEAISDEAIDQMVFRLRKKIEDDPTNPFHIQTVKGQGLKFEP